MWLLEIRTTRNMTNGSVHFINCQYNTIVIYGPLGNWLMFVLYPLCTNINTLVCIPYLWQQQQHSHINVLQFWFSHTAITFRNCFRFNFLLQVTCSRLYAYCCLAQRCHETIFWHLGNMILAERQSLWHEMGSTRQRGKTGLGCVCGCKPHYW